ncbi:hypothetical protein LINPERHAP2_LOCUS39618 [Linum perenne]
MFRPCCHCVVYSRILSISSLLLPMSSSSPMSMSRSEDW